MGKRVNRMNNEDEIFEKNIGKEIGIGLWESDVEGLDSVIIGKIVSVSGRWLGLSIPEFPEIRYFNISHILFFMFDPEEITRDGRMVVKAVHKELEDE